MSVLKWNCAHQFNSRCRLHVHDVGGEFGASEVSASMTYTATKFERPKTSRPWLRAAQSEIEAWSQEDPASGIETARRFHAFESALQ